MKRCKDLTPTEKTNSSQLRSGTGFMPSLSEGITEYEAYGYTDPLVPCFDRFTSRSGEIEIFPDEIIVENIIRFENASDPDDQSILYVISAPKKNIKGLYCDSYGLYHDDLSEEMLRVLQEESKRVFLPS